MPNRWIYLSYAVDENTPAYGNGERFQRSLDKDMSRGDSCNTSTWTFSNHLGTHLDFPRHFSEHGRTMDDYSVEFFHFRQIGLIDLGEVENGKIVGWEDLKTSDLPDEMEMLLVKTGFCLKRHQPAYWRENPGFSPELADRLRESFPQLRVLGFDSISVSSFTNRELGREAHRSFLDHEHPILLLEDMDLDSFDSVHQVNQIIVAPWRVAQADAVPCTVLAEIIDEE